jgi:SAM-dependent methyltransferase
MAINLFSYMICKEAYLKGALPSESAIIEFGEANWYGDVSLATLFDDINALVEEDAKREAMLARLGLIEALPPGNDKSFGLAKLFYEFIYGCKRLASIDLGGTEAAIRHDLNLPLPLDEQFDIAINNGTAEHVFDLAQFFRTMHERTKPGGLMIHEAPFTGWIDHGFYSFQPTFFFDLAHANGYKAMLVAHCDFSNLAVTQINGLADVRKLQQRDKGLEGDSNLFVMLRKGGKETPFSPPFQGYYANRLSEEDRQAWKNRGKS